MAYPFINALSRLNNTPGGPGVNAAGPAD